MIEALSKNSEILDNATVIPGQGVSESDILKILSLASENVDTEFLRLRQARAGMSETHKRRSVNSIISSPRQISEDLYEADLLLDERSELMNDHQTGQHIQGMILIEAARQLFLAVTERFFIANSENNGYYFVINKIDTRYMAFVFPIGATLRYEILEKSIENSERLSFHVKITVTQTEVDATEVIVKFTAFLADKIKKKEHAQATVVLERTMETFENSAV